MKVKLTPVKEVILLTEDGKAIGELAMTPELELLLGGRSRTYEATWENGVLTLGEEHAN